MAVLGRRRLLAAGLATAGLGLAGCSSDSNGGDPGGTGADSGDGGGPTDGGSPTEDGGGTATPDVVGGPKDLQSRVDVRATVLDEDQGHGRYVFTPEIAWIETGGTVMWHFEGSHHTVSTYHPNNERWLRIPNEASGFSSRFAGAGDPGTGFNYVFDVPGVYNYFCGDHEDKGMVGLVVVGEPKDGPGMQPPENVASDAAASELTRLIGVVRDQT